MRNIMLAGAAGLVLALTGTTAFAIPRTTEILAYGQDQDAVGAFLPFAAQGDNANVYLPAAPRSFGGEGSNTGAGVGGTGSHR
jgi:hypothetical protein